MQQQEYPGGHLTSRGRTSVSHLATLAFSVQMGAAMDRHSLEGRLLGEVATHDIVKVVDNWTVTAAAAQAGTASWIVVTNAAHEPMGLLRQTRLAHGQANQPVARLINRPTVVLPATLTLAESLRAWPFHELKGVLTELDGVIAVNETSVALGVWSGPEFNSLMSRVGGGRYHEAFLAGTTDVGWYQDFCRFTEPVSYVQCGEQRSFSRPRDEQPWCSNPKHLMQHRFVGAADTGGAR